MVQISVNVGCIIALSQISTVVTSSVWVTDEDRVTAADAVAAKVTLCSWPAGTDYHEEGGRSTLMKGLGGENNFILEAFKDAHSREDVPKQLQEHITIAWAIRKTWPLASAILLTVVWYICCWTACPFCKCCRCCASEKPNSKCCKFITFALGVALGIAFLIPVNLANEGYSHSVDGYDTTACAGATLADTMLGGDDRFIGMLPLLEKFSAIEGSLDSNSPMMTQVRSALNETESVKDSLTLATEVLRVLSDALGKNFPKQQIEDNFHVCHFCDEMVPILDQAATKLDEGVAAAMEGVRSEVDEQLNPENSAKLQQTFRDAANPILEVKGTVTDNLKPFINTGTLTDIRDMLEGDRAPGQLIVYLLVAFAFVLFVLMGSSLFVCMCCDRTEKQSPSGETYTHYNECLPKCACCTWCCAWFFAICALLVGGVFTATSVPLSGLCLMLDEMNVPMLKAISDGVGLNLTSADSAMVESIFDQCFFNTDPSANPSLMDIIIVKQENGTDETLRTQVVDQVRKQVTGEFDKLTESMDAPDIGNTPEIKNLVAILENNAIDTLIVSDSNQLKGDDSYKAMFASESLTKLSVSSVACLNHTVTQEVPNIGGETIPGVTAFVEALAAFGPKQVGTDCAKPVTCNDAAGTPDGETCIAGNNFVELKQNIRNLNTFRCDLFENPGTNAICDPGAMTHEKDAGKTKWSGDCLSDTVGMTVKERTCSLDVFKTYVENFGNRIHLAFGRLDVTTKELMPIITNELKNTVDQYLLDPIDKVADGVTCTFMGHAYDDLVKGFCFQGVAGFVVISGSYVATGCLAFAMVIFMYIVWRRAVDNANSDDALERGVADEEHSQLQA